MPIANELTIDTSASDMEMAQTIFGSGVQVIDATYSGNAASSGIYTGAQTTIAGVTNSDSGVILSTGNAADFTNSSGSTNTNVSAGTGVDVADGIDGDSDLNAVAGQNTFDGAILEATFIPEGDMLTMQFVFTSEEYPEYVLLNVNDSFGIWVNGQFVEATITASGNIAIDSVNQTHNQNLYQSNDADQFNTEMDGLTYTLTFKAPVNPGQLNTIKIGIADGGDAIYDSNVLISADSIQTVALAIDDQVQLAANSSRVVDVLANDRDLYDTGLTITHIMGQPATVGTPITLSTGEQVTLNADGTLTVTSDGDLGTNVLTYQLVDGQGNTDVGYLTITTVGASGPDGIVSGTAGDDLIDTSYLGDPDGDHVDDNDATGVYGTAGEDDYILAGAGNDTVLSGAGNDFVAAGDGDDSVDGGAGNDTISAGVGDDTVSGGAGDDVAYLGAGNDVFTDTDGDDSVYGGAGSDSLSGGAGYDVVSGGSEDDTLSGGAGDDTILGGDGADTVLIMDNDDYDNIDGGEGGPIDADTIWFGNLVSNSGVNVTYSGDETGTYTYDSTAANGEFYNIEGLVLTEYDDIVDATASGTDNTFSGGAGADTIDGGSGYDSIEGGVGNDSLSGGEGDDQIFGGDGDDTVAGGGGDDSLEGGAGNDSLDGGIGADTIQAGDGDDTLTGGDDQQVPSYFGAEYTTLSGVSSVVTGTQGNPDFTYVVTSNNGDVLESSASVASEFGGSETLTGYQVGNGADANEVHTHTFGADVGGVQMRITGLNTTETLVIYIDGLPVDLNQAIYNGLVSFDPGTTSYYIDVNGNLAASSDPSGLDVPATLTINSPLSTLSVENLSPSGLGDGTIYELSVNTTPAWQVLEDGADSLSGGAGNDVILGQGGDDSLFGEAGNDSLDGGDGNDSLEGGDGNDTLIGGAGDDTLSGGADRDVIHGSGGDVVDGGEAGDDFDTLIVNDVASVTYGGGNNESGTVTFNDLSTLTFDNIEQLIVDGVGPAVGDGIVHGTTGDDTMGIGYIDAQGDIIDGADGLDDTILGFDGNDEIHAGSGNDSVDGGTGEDTIFGDAGNDTLESGVGADSVSGGDGDDSITNADGYDVVYGGDGNDTIIGSGQIWGDAGNDLIDFTGSVPDALPNQVNGGDGDDTIIGGDATDEVVYLSAGNDTFSGGGNTTYLDWVSARDLGQGASIDLASGSASFGSNTLLFSGVEAAQGSDFNDTITGDAADNQLIGGSGNDIITAGDGNDTIWGDDGADTIYAGGGDVVTGGEGVDDHDTLIVDGIVSITYGGGNNEAGTILLDDGSTVIFSEIETIQEAGVTPDGLIWGTNGAESIGAGYIDANGDVVDNNDAILSNPGSNDDEIYALDGNDTVQSLLGDDDVYGGDGDDLIQTGVGNDYAQGDAGNDTLEGDDGDDFLRGDAGNDSVYGGAGNDSVYGGAGNDHVYGGDGDDEIYGGYGDDTVYGGAGNDTITGSGENDEVYGDDGDDYMQGSNGADTMYGGAGNDTMLGEEDADTFYGGAGDYVDGYETVTTGTDNDTLYVVNVDFIVYDPGNGENGVVHFIGGGTLDFFNIENIYADGVLQGGSDEIVDGTAAGDSIAAGIYTDVDGDVVDGADNSAGNNDDVIRGLGGNDTIEAGDGNDLVYGGTENDFIGGDSGNDTLFGDQGDDALFGGDGNDTLDGGIGNDYLSGDAGDDRFVLTDGSGDDQIIGGETGETTGDTLDASAITGDVVLNLAAGNPGDPEDGQLLNGSDITTFQQIETIILGSGDDSVLGSSGADTVAMGDGADTVNGGAGDDRFDLGAGDGDVDLVVLGDGDGADTVAGFEAPTFAGGTYTGQDQLDVSGLLDGGSQPVDTADVVVTDTNGNGTGDAILTFPDGTSVTLTGVTPPAAGIPAWLEAMGIPPAAAVVGPVDGTAGDDLMNPGYTDAQGDQVDGTDGDNDTIFGNDGNDTINAGAGDDLVYGGAGADVLRAVSGNDSLYGDQGDDDLQSGSGNDLMDGGDGSDLIHVDDNSGDDTVIGGETGEGGAGDVLNIDSASVAATVTFTGDEAGTVSVGSSTVTFSEIETIWTDDGNDTIDGSAATGPIRVWAGGGDDSIIGGSGADNLSGDAGNDSILGGAGADTLTGGVGNDTLDGGDGADSLNGGEGDDQIFGGAGNDVIIGFEGSDTVDGGDGDDLINTRTSPGTGAPDQGLVHPTNPALSYPADLDPNNDRDSVLGGAGNDTILTGDDDDTIYGGTGNDSIEAGFDDDLVYGGDGRDTIEGSEGADTVFGEDGDDVIFGGLDPTNPDYALSTQYDLTDDIDPDATNNADSLFGGAGNDWIYGGDDADTIDGGEGNDLIFGGIDDDSLTGGDGIDTLMGGQGNDVLFGGADNDMLLGEDGDDALYGGTEVDRLEGGDGNDILDGGAGNDALFGDAGNDYANGGSGDDTLSGGAGEDTLEGGSGDDVAYGGQGNDFIDGMSGNDLIFGDDGDDTLSGDAGNDTLTGGAGNDVMHGDFDRDTFFAGIGDTVDGGEGGDDYDTLDLTSYGASVNVIYDVGNSENGTVQFLDGLGAVVGTMAFSNIENVITAPYVPCFTPGALIATNRGQMRVEDLQVGDQVLTRDNGYQELRWVGQRALSAVDLAAMPKLRPVRIGKGSLGLNLPERDLVVSPQHRMLITSSRADLLFGEHEVLVAAAHLLERAGVRADEAVEGVTYIHLLFDQHEIIRANGAWSESYQPGELTLAGMDDGPRQEILTLFPELALGLLFPAARVTLKKHEVSLLFSR